MDHKVEILGVKIDNIRAADAMEKIEEFLKTDVLSTIGLITAGILLEAGKSEAYKEMIENLSLSMIGDRMVLDGAGITSAERRMEVDNNWFVTTFLEYIQQEQKTTILLAETEEDKISYEKYLRENYPELVLAASYSLEDATEDEDSIVNLMNGVTADIIFASLPSPYQESFVMTNKQKLNAKIWLGIGKFAKLKNRAEAKPGFWEGLMEKREFKKRLSQYQNDKKE